MKNNKLIHYITFSYLSFPILIFFLGWLRLYYACILSILLIYSIRIFIKKIDFSSNIKLTFSRKLIVPLGLSFLWIVSSGIGGFANQDWDHHFRNALLRDLIQNEWPVYYSFPSNYKIPDLANHYSALNYYFTFWLPAALVGKLVGSVAANIFLFLWSYLGVLLALYYLNRLFKFKYIIFVSLLFMFWSGMDILGKFFLFNMLNIKESIEIYFGNFFYTSFISDIFNVYNQAIPTWIVTLWVLNFRRELNLLPILFLIAYAPFPFVGLSIFYAIYYVIDKFRTAGTSKIIFTKIRLQLIRLENLSGLLSIFLPYILFYSAHTNDVPSSFFWTSHSEKSFTENLNLIISYFATYFFEVGVYLAIIFLYSKKVYNSYKIIFWVCLGVLLIMPLWVVGHYGDFASRGSIPALTIVCVMTIKTLVDYHEKHFLKYQLIIPIIVLLLTWITPFLAILRSIPTTGSPKLREAIGTFSNPAITKENDEQRVYASLMNFYSHEPKKYFFYKYMTKR